MLLSLASACATSRAAPAGVDVLSRMSLDEKIGQLFVYASTGRFMNEESAEYRALVHQVRDNRVGGVMWFLFSDVYETAFLDRKLQELARTPLLIAADLEAGPGMRFRDTTYWPWPMAVAATGDPALAERQGRIVAEEARAIGINQIYAPVADVNVDPDNPVINVRSFGEDPQDVARFVAAFVRGAQEGERGVLATAKHFPGHGDTHVDSHRSLPILTADAGRLDAVELVPFRAAIAAGVASIMTAHLAVPSLDATPAPPRPEGTKENPYTKDPGEITRDATVPASLSPAVTEGLLRRRLGFRGLVLTDAMDMGSLSGHFDPGEAVVLAILAGADQLLKCPDIDRAAAAIRAAVESGRISRSRLDESVARILAAKARARAGEGASGIDFDRIFRVLDRPDHRALAAEIAARSITLVREEPGVLPILRTRRVAHVIVSDQPRLSSELTAALGDRLASPPSSYLLDNQSGAADAEAAVAGAGAADEVILSFYVRFESGRGAISIPAPARPAIDRILAGQAPTVVVVFGSPYLLRDLPGAKTALLAWGSQSDEQAAAARALFGEAPIAGRLPVTIPGIAAKGAGIDRRETVR